MIITLKKSQAIDAIRDARSESIGSIGSTITVDADAPFKADAMATTFECHSNDERAARRYNDDDAIRQSLQSIVVLNSPSNNNNPQVQSLLNKYNGHLMTIGEHLLQSLHAVAPTQLAARVGDYNENLFYEMQDHKKDVRSIILDNLQVTTAAAAPNDSTNTGSSNPSLSQDLKTDIQNFEISLRDVLKHNRLTYRGSFMRTERTMFQPAHVDYDYPVLREYSHKLYIAFFPLTKEGTFLQLWKDDRSSVGSDDATTVEGTVVYIPYGNMLIVPADTIHGGGFKRGEHGNLRFHLYIELLEQDENETPITNETTTMKNYDLLIHPMNKYTEEYDRRRELCERFVDANGLDRLIGVFFDD